MTNSRQGKATKRERWATSLHEAAHIEVARALNRWNCSCHAAVLPNGGGLASLPDGLTGWARIVATAAGTYGGKLARIFNTPRRRKSDQPAPGASTAPDVRDTVATWAQANFSEAVRLAPDEREVARYCIDGHENEPREWGARYRRIHAAARLEVWRNRSRIYETARLIFLNGAAYIRGDPEDDEFFRAHRAEKKQEPTNYGGTS